MGMIAVIIMGAEAKTALTTHITRLVNMKTMFSRGKFRKGCSEKNTFGTGFHENLSFDRGCGEDSHCVLL